MRLRMVPHTGWSLADPRRYRFAISNGIWDYKLKPAAFMILSYLCYCDSVGRTASLTSDSVARGVHMTAGTVKKHLGILAGKRLITDELQLTARLPCTGSGNYFSLPNEIFLLQLSPSAFLVYAYLLLIEDRRSHTCHPSYNTIAAAAGISKNTAIKSIGTFLETGLIAVESSSYFDRHGLKWKGNNLYTILPVGVAMDAFYTKAALAVGAKCCQAGS